jgi:hypothetical protein
MGNRFSLAALRVRCAPWVIRGVLAGLLAFIAPGGCAAVRRAKEKQATKAEARLAAPRDSVHRAALRVLPEFDLIPTSDYMAGGFIEAHGDWGTPREGAIVQISSSTDNEATKIVVEAGRSSRLSKAEMRTLARAILDGIRVLLFGQATSGF